MLDSNSFGRQWHVHAVGQNLAVPKIGSCHNARHMPFTSTPMAELKTNVGERNSSFSIVSRHDAVMHYGVIVAARRMHVPQIPTSNINQLLPRAFPPC